MVVIIYTPLINEDWSRVVLEDSQKAYVVCYNNKTQYFRLRLYDSDFDALTALLVLL